MFTRPVHRITKQNKTQGRQKKSVNENERHKPVDETKLNKFEEKNTPQRCRPHKH